MPTRRPSRTRLLPLLTVVALVLVSCSSDDSSSDASGAGDPDSTTTTTAAAAPTELDVTTSDYAYALSTEEVAEGLVTVNETNEGAENHQVTLVRLEATQTPIDLADALEDQGDIAAAPDAYAGGTNNTVSGGTNSATVPLTEGSYALICFIPNEDGESHFTLGMVGALDVVASVAEPVTPPETDTTVVMSDFAFGMPQGFSAEGMVEVVNDGEQAHEWTVNNPDNTVGTGLAAIAPGATAYVPIDLPDGDYIFNCFVTDPQSRAPHIALGMTAEISVPGGG